MVKCFPHGLRGFKGAVQRRLATLTVTRLEAAWFKEIINVNNLDFFLVEFDKKIIKKFSKETKPGSITKV